LGLSNSQGTWLEAGAYIIGILLPIFIASLLILYAEGGVAALQKWTHDYLLVVIPSVARMLDEPLLTFETPRSSRTNSKRRSHVKVNALVNRNSSIANYAILVPTSVLPGQTTGSNWIGKSERIRVLLRLELNVRKLNVNLLFDRQLLSAHGVRDFENAAELSSLFEHTLDGARQEGYEANTKLVPCEVAGKQYVCLVLRNKLEKNFVTLATEKLYVAQDLMLMIRSAISERPALFERE
jgi:hypothetical protein